MICSCHRIATDPYQNHLATCTYFSVRGNIYYGETPFCPYPPTVSVTKQLPIEPDQSEPLDLMSYFVDERLMEMADSEDPVQFFREYMAGFVISKRESAVSHCGWNSSADGIERPLSVEDLMCYMLSTTPVVQSELLFVDSIGRQDNISMSDCGRDYDPLLTYSRVLSCLSHVYTYTDPHTMAAQYPRCNDTVLNMISSDSFVLSLTRNITDYAMIDNDFEVDGAVRQMSDSEIVNGDNLVGRLYAPYGGAEITGATVYYNNQVICVS